MNVRSNQTSGQKMRQVKQHADVMSANSEHQTHSYSSNRKWGRKSGGDVGFGDVGFGDVGFGDVGFGDVDFEKMLV